MREYKTHRDLEKEAKAQRARAEQYFSEAAELRDVREQTTDPEERLKLSKEILEKGWLGAAEIDKAIKIGERFIKDLKRIGKRGAN